MLAVQWQEDKVTSGSSSHLRRRRFRAENERTVFCVHGGWKLRDRALEQLFGGSSPVRWPPEQASRSVGTAESARSVDDGLSVVCPESILRERRLTCQPHQPLTDQIPDPDVGFLIADVKRDASPVA